MSTTYPLVKITWVDAATWHGSCALTTALADYHLVTRHTVGWLLAKDTERIMIVHTLDECESNEIPEGADFTLVPRHWATKVVLLTEGNEL